MHARERSWEAGGAVRPGRTPGQTMPGMSLVGSWESDVFTTAGDVGGTARAH